jgi:hypothetical protein
MNKARRRFNKKQAAIFTNMGDMCSLWYKIKIFNK